jgi:type I restriction enzyme, S subunit
MRVFAAIDALRSRVPADWELTALKRVAQLKEQRNLDAKADLLSLRNTGELTPRGDDVQPPSAEYVPRYWLVDEGDLVVNPMWLAGGAVGVSRAAGAVSPDYRVYELSKALEPRYVHYLLRSATYNDQYRLLMRAETTFDRRVRKEDFGNLPLVVPPRAIQRAVADFLDAETMRIDALREKKRRMIELLDERQLALIDSLVSDFRADPLKHLVAIDVSNVDKLMVEGQQPVRLCNYTDVYYHREITESLNLMAATATLEQRHKFELRAGSVLITKDSEIADDIAVPAFVPRDLPGVLCGYHLAILTPRPDRIEGAFLYWALRSQFVRQQFSVAATGVTRFGLRTDAIGAVQIPLPKLDIQRRIAIRLRGAQSAEDRVTSALERQIGLLHERRLTITTAAVTGRLDVAKAAA